VAPPAGRAAPGLLALVAGAVHVRERASGGGAGEGREASRLPGLLLVPPYLAAAAWAVRRRGFRYLIYSAPFLITLAASAYTQVRDNRESALLDAIDDVDVLATLAAVQLARNGTTDIP